MKGRSSVALLQDTYCEIFYQVYKITPKEDVSFQNEEINKESELLLLIPKIKLELDQIESADEILKLESCYEVFI